ncbi:MULTISPECIES: ABC transporter ATP-binding protein [Nocardiaceae]|uniref:ABC transporter ATP-binding protein n=1 Tax=Nocardiaceae TaxID=85025 RepID=UPI00061E41C8|nr:MULTISPECIES: ABC transporter ATP-binding protein [Rhodococcus]KJV03565.1 ABC branched-chain amino acid transporter, permease component [Rhodococcus sp. PML026]
MSDLMLEVDDLRICYGDAIAVDGVSFSVETGRCLAVLGANGAGKSSIAQALAGLIPADRGTISVGRENVTGTDAFALARKGIAYLPEGRGIFPGLSTADNVALGTRILPKEARAAAVDRLYTLFPVLGDRRKQQASTLSGGEQQMLAVGRALVTDPTLFVVDELSLGLAPLVIDKIYEALQTAKAAGTTMILIEQYVERALEFADDAVVMRRGEIVWSGAANGAVDEVVQNYMGGTAVEPTAAAVQ